MPLFDAVTVRERARRVQPSATAGDPGAVTSTIEMRTVDGSATETYASEIHGCRSSRRSTASSSIQSALVDPSMCDLAMTRAVVKRDAPVTSIVRTASNDDRETTTAARTRTETTTATSPSRTRHDLKDLADSEVEIANEMDLRFEQHTRMRQDALTDGLDQLQDVRGGRPVARDDEVRVLFGHRRATHRHPPPPGLLDQARRAVGWRVLEDAAAVLLGERLRSPAPLTSLVHPRADRRPVGRDERHARADDDCISGELRASVRQGHVGGFDPPRCAEEKLEDVDALEYVRHLASVRTRVHADGATDARGDGHPELQPRQTMGECDARKRGERHRASGSQAFAITRGPSVRATQSQDEPVESVVGHEHVRSLAQDDERDGCLAD